MKRISLAIGLLLTGLSSTANADIPAWYKGKPFDPTVAGGPTLPTSVQAGPYAIPGRLQFVYYDMGGSGVGYQTTDHIGCAASGYRMDGQTASLCLTSQMADPYATTGDIWFMTGNPALDGTFYPSPTTADPYIGAVRPGDWVNVTVNVTTAGTYVVGSTWASGNGNPGKEGGDGAMELTISLPGATANTWTQVLDWKATFPNYNTTANFHNWMPYPNMGTIQLQAGMTVVQMKSIDPHLNLDYVEFSLAGADGGVISGGSGSGSGTSAGSGSSASGSATSGTLAASGTAGASGSAGSGATSASGASSTSGVASSGSLGATSGTAASGSLATSGTTTSGGAGSGTINTSGAGGAGTGTNAAAAGAAPGSTASSASSKGCAVGVAPERKLGGLGFVLGLAALIAARSRRSRSRS